MHRRIMVALLGSLVLTASGARAEGLGTATLNRVEQEVSEIGSRHGTMLECDDVTYLGGKIEDRTNEMTGIIENAGASSDQINQLVNVYDSQFERSRVLLREMAESQRYQACNANIIIVDSEENLGVQWDRLHQALEAD